MNGSLELAAPTGRPKVAQGGRALGTKPRRTAQAPTGNAVKDFFGLFLDCGAFPPLLFFRGGRRNRSLGKAPQSKLRVTLCSHGCLHFLEFLLFFGFEWAKLGITQWLFVGIRWTVTCAFRCFANVTVRDRVS